MPLPISLKDLGFFLLVPQFITSGAKKMEMIKVWLLAFSFLPIFPRTKQRIRDCTSYFHGQRVLLLPAVVYSEIPKQTPMYVKFSHHNTSKSLVLEASSTWLGRPFAMAIPPRSQNAIIIPWKNLAGVNLGSELALLIQALALRSIWCIKFPSTKYQL